MDFRSVNNMNIALLTRGGFENPKIWSGTPKTMLELFKKRPNINTIGVDTEMGHYVRGAYFHCLCSWLFLMYHCNDWFLRPIYRRIMHRTYTKIGKQDFSIQINDYFITKEMEKYGKHAVYVDAHRPEWWAQLCRKDKRLFRNWYIKDFNKASKCSLHNADLVFTQNEWTREAFIRDFGLDKEKVKNVRFGVNLKPLLDNKDYGRNLMLIVLRQGFEESKGLNLLLKAMPYIRRQVPNAELAVVGTPVGNDVEGVTCYVNEPRETTIRLFKECTLYTMPALAEPNGITYLEGLANKAPIVGLNRFALPEFTGNGEWGFLCNKEDPEELAYVIVDALSDKDRLKTMGEKGQKFVADNFVWEKVIDRMITEMRKI